MNDRHYAKMADEIEGRSFHDIKVAYGDRLTLSEGATGRAWLKFNPGKQLIYVDDAEGHPRGLTPKQYAVLVIVFDTIKAGAYPTMRALSQQLECAPSTVSRAMTKLAAWGLIRYIVGRGRYAGMLIFRAMPNDGLDRLRAVAKAKLRRWYLASQERISRLRFNVAPREPLTRGEVSLPTITVGATLTAQPFSVQDLRDVGII